MNYFGRPIKFIFSRDLNGNTAKGAGDLIDTHHEDMAHFRNRTKGNVVIMGYKTYITLDEPLKGRLNVVYSELPLKTSELRKGFYSHQDSVELIQDYILENDAFVYCIGGVQTFDSFMKHTNSMPQEMYVTTYCKRVEDGNCPATFFPEIKKHYDKVILFYDGKLEIIAYFLKKKV